MCETSPVTYLNEKFWSGGESMIEQQEEVETEVKLHYQKYSKPFFQVFTVSITRQNNTVFLH